MGYLRLLLSIGVLGAHAGVLPDSLSRTMVSCFFLLSGFLIALTLDKNYTRNPVPFYWNRLLRIYPLHITVLLFILCALPEYARQRLGEGPFFDWNLLVGSLLLWFSAAGQLNSPAWTLPYELTFYLLAPLIAYFRLPGFIAYTLIGSIAHVWFFKEGSPFGPLVSQLYPSCAASCAASCALFGLGGIACHINQRFKPHSWSPITRLSSLSFLTLLILSSSRFLNSGWLLFNQQYGAIAGHLSVFIVCTFLISWSKKEGRLSRLSGDLCYPVYLIHWPIFQVWLSDNSWASFIRSFAGLFANGDYAIKLLIGSLLTLFLSFGWLWLERRLLRQLRCSHNKSARKFAAPEIYNPGKVST